MAIDNLNYYSAWLPAGQLTDRYSSQPWCLRSKNLDIFSSSKSVKATAWSNPITIWSDVIDQDDYGRVQLKTDWKIYENWVEILDPATNFPVYPVSYTWKNGTYNNAQRWTPKRMLVKYDGNDWKSLVVYTDTSAYYYNKTAYVLDKNLSNARKYWGWDEDLTRDSDGYIKITQNGSWSAPNTTWIRLTVAWHDEFGFVPVRLKCDWGNTTYIINSWDTWVSSTQINENAPSKKVRKYYYDPELDAMTPEDDEWDLNDLVRVEGELETWLLIYLPVLSEDVTWTFFLKDSVNTHSWGSFWIDFNYPDGWSEAVELKDWDFNEYYSYLPLNEDRDFVQVWEYYWMPWTTFQLLWEWNSSWESVNWNKQIRWEFQQYMWWANPTEMTVIWMIVWNEQVYMIWNMHGDWYIFPCDLSWSRWTPYIAYGCEFMGVTNIDYLLYLVWEDRGISSLWVYNWQELVPIVWWKLESQYVDLVWVEEQYKFDWKMINWRKNLILSTRDNRIFQYWQTYGGKWWTFIHELPANAVITGLKANWKDLEVDYSITVNNVTTKYTVKYQDDTPIKNYNTEWMAEYPIILWNHLLEKEESDLFVSYILPSANTSLEFWGMANHYHFWTFKTDWNTTPTVWSQWMIDGTDFNYHLDFVEKNWEYLTFKLVWELPVMTGQETMRLTEYLTMQEPTYIWYTEFNHFRKIWEITTTEYKEWEFRFHNLNNKLELPKSHSLQIMVRGKWNQNYTPELFALDLVANQRERW